MSVGPAVAAQAAPAGLKPNSETTVSQNLLRDGWDQAEPGLTPAVVQGGKFGQLFATKVVGQVYAQPLVVDNPATASTDVIVGTEDDWVYRLDGTTGQVLQETQLGTPWSYTVNGCKNIWPDLGITSTPVYDPSTGTVYVVAIVTNGNPTVTTPTVELFALNEQTLAVEWSKSISGTAANDPKQKFNAEWERQRAGLLLMNGWVYTAFASYCDAGTYSGFISGVDVANKGTSSTLWSDEAGSPDANPQAGIWQSGSGLMSDGPGRIFFASGNGTSPPPGPGGSQTPTELGDSVVRLAVSSTGSLTPADFFSPANAPTLDANDVDFGSGGPVGLPFGTSTYPHLLVQAGKDGRVFLLNRDSLGGRQQGPNGTDKPVSVSGPFGGQWSHPAAFAGVNTNGTAADYVYVAGRSDYLRALELTGSSTAPTLTDVGNSPGWFGYESGAPVVTSDGTDPSSAIVWEASSNNGMNDQLEAFDAIPSNGTLKEIWSAPIGSTHFAHPATDDDRVYVGSKNDGTGTDAAHGVVYGFGVSNQMPLLAPQVNFEDVGVSAPATGKTLDATATATEPVEVSGLTAPTSPLFTLGTPSVATPGGSTTPVAGFPVLLQAGQRLIIPVTFTPTAAGAVSDSIQLSTLVGSAAGAAIIPLAAVGAAPGLAAYPASLAFGANGSGSDSDTNTGPIPVGSSEAIQANITNTGTTAETITSVTPPTAPFTVTGVKAGDNLGPGQSETATVTYTPTIVTSSDSGSLTIAGTAGTVTVQLTGVSVAGNGVLTPSATTVSFGSVHLGQSATGGITLTNTGNLPVTVTSFTAPGVPFGTPVPVPKSLTINVGDSISLPVTFTPQSAGAAGGSYQITTTDGQTAAKTVTLSVSGAGTPPASGIAIPSPGGGWTLNGTARMTGTTLELTPGWHNAAGSAVYYQPLASSGLKVSFRAQMSGNLGGDGMTFALISPGDTTSALGKDSGGLGFGGLHGIAVALATHKDAGFPSANFVGITTGTTGSGGTGTLRWAATSSAVPNLRSGTHLIAVAVSGSGSTRTITVSVDGKQYLKTVVPLAATVLPAFTAGTGATTAEGNLASSVSLSSAAGPVPPPGGGWSYNGSAQMSGSDTKLTPATANQAGTVIYPKAVSTSSITATFNLQIGGGTGANGITLAFLDPTDNVTGVGGYGAGFGVSGLPGDAVVLSTYQVPGAPSSNYVAVTAEGSTGQPSIKGVSSGIPVLRTGTVSVTVTLTTTAAGAGTFTVYIDGAQVLGRTLRPTPSSMLLAFSGSTGNITDVHLVRNAALSATAW